MEIVFDDQQLVDEKFELNESAITKLSENQNENPCTVISIIGPQNSGKSTFMNKAFGTNFGVLPKGKHFEQTTKGIWMARCNNPNMILLDVEGFDSNSRTKNGETVEQGQKFDSQSALFSLAVSNIMILNMKKDDFGKQQGGGGTMLQSIFKEIVKMKSQTKVVVAVRDADIDEEPDPIDLQNLTNSVRSKIEKDWEKVNPNVSISQYIEVFVEAFPLLRPSDVFAKKCIEVKNKFLDDGELTTNVEHRYSTSKFVHYVRHLWESVHGNENLEIPNQQELRCSYECEKATDNIIKSLLQNNEFTSLMDIRNEENYKSPARFIQEMKKFLNHALQEYDTNTILYSSGHYRESQKQRLKEQILKLMQKKWGVIADSRFKKLISLNEKHIWFFLYSGACDNDNIRDDALDKYLDAFDLSTKGLVYEYDHYFYRALNHAREVNLKSLKDNLSKEMKAIELAKSKEMCKLIRKQIIRSIEYKKDYQSLMAMEAKTCPKDFALDLKSLLERTFTQYHRQTTNYDPHEKTRQEVLFRTEILQSVEGQCRKILDSKRQSLFEENKKKIEESSDSFCKDDETSSTLFLGYLTMYTEFTYYLSGEYADIINKMQEKLYCDIANCVVTFVYTREQRVNRMRNCVYFGIGAAAIGTVVAITGGLVLAPVFAPVLVPLCDAATGMFFVSLNAANLTNLAFNLREKWIRQPFFGDGSCVQRLKLLDDAIPSETEREELNNRASIIVNLVQDYKSKGFTADQFSLIDDPLLGRSLSDDI